MICTKCLKDKPKKTENFYKDRSRKGGFDSRCKECRSILNRSRDMNEGMNDRRNKFSVGTPGTEPWKGLNIPMKDKLTMAFEEILK